MSISTEAKEFISYVHSLTRADLEAKLSTLTPKQLEMLDDLLLSEAKEHGWSLWVPQIGMQKQVLENEADEVYCGGMAGPGKTEVIIGAALTHHLHSVIFRRVYKHLESIVDRVTEIVGHQSGLNRSSYKWRRPDNRFPIGWSLEFGAAQHPGDEESWQGRAHDLKGFDEVAQFSERQYIYLCGWLRSSAVGQRKRIIGAGNPPLTAEGAWLFERYRAWLDIDHPNPAKDGEIRWFARGSSGREYEVDGPEQVFIEDEWVLPASRTFIRGYLDKNAYIGPEYKARLQAMPPAERAVFLEGDFTVWAQEDLWQVIPTGWVRQAQERWKQRERPDAKMTTIGVDPARGGQDETVLSPRTQNYFHEQVCVPGVQTPDGPSVAALVLKQIEHGEDPLVLVDAIGIGGAVIDALQDKCRFNGLQSSGKSAAKEKTGHYGFVSKRAEWWWKFREALDPENGQDIALPPDKQLLQDLIAPRYKVQSNGIRVEEKPEIIKRLGRSPDRGDSLVYAFAESGFAGITEEHFDVVHELKSANPPWKR